MSNVMTFAFRLAWALTLAGGLGELKHEVAKKAAYTKSRGLVSLKRLDQVLHGQGKASKTQDSASYSEVK